MMDRVGRAAAVIAVAAGAAGGAQGGDAPALAYERELRYDASTRVSLLDDAAPGSGHDARGFFLTDGGANKLYIGGNAQFRYIANWRDDTVSPDSGFANGFTFRRTRLAFTGTVLDPKLSFNVQMDFLAAGSPTLVEAFGEYKLRDTLVLRWGQFKLPLLQEELNSFLRLQTVERSTVNTVFTQNYSQGVQLRHDGAWARLFGAFSDGLNTLNTEFTRAGPEADWALTGRAEFKWAGDWKQLDQFTSWRGSPYAGFLGLAAHYQNGGSTAAPGEATPTSTLDRSVFQYTADVSTKGDGWNVFAAFVGRHTDDHPTDRTFDDFGLLVSAGLFVSDAVEIFARYDEVFPDDEYTSGGTDNFAEITGGFNWYMVKDSHAAKFTTDVVWFLDDQAGSSALVRGNQGVGLLASAGEDQIALRVQMQLMF